MNENFSDRRILIVDDTPENIDLLGEILSNYKKMVALNGEKALKLATGSNKPDLILLDVMMPGMDGFEVCKKLKADPATKDIPVIFITAKSEVEDETRGLELGAVDFIPKPISPPVVHARVKNQLELLSAREILQRQNIELTVRNKYITDSINYAERIQHAILPSEESFKKIFPDSFLIFKPKDIVSGDFYWADEVNNKKIAACIDCTGHGVPGSLMSMIGNALLNEIINLQKILDPAEVLNVLNDGIINELNKETNIETYDGMDLGLCVIDGKNKTLSFAGAFRPLYYFQNNIFFKLPGERKSIGDKKKKIKFTTQTFNYSEGFTFYLFTDGLPDQNNDRNEKFGFARFRSLLQDIHLESFSYQKEKIISELAKHQKNEVQRDDITVIGIKL